MKSRFLFGLLLVVLAGCDSSFTVGSISMEPTLKEGETFKVRPAADTEAIPRGTIVVFKSLEDASIRIVSRVVATAGERIEIFRKKVSIDGQALEETYVKFSDPRILPGDHSVSEIMRKRDHLDGLTIPEDHFFIMGDNRDQSFDSRHYGPIPRTHIVGIVELKAP